MKDSDFELLVTSVKQAGRIKRGELEPARKFEVRAEDVAAENPAAVAAALDPREAPARSPSAAAGSRSR